MSDHPGYPPLGTGAGPDAPAPLKPAAPAPRSKLSQAAAGTLRPKCPMCDCEDFQRESGSLDSDFGLTAHRVDILICQTCSYVLLFGKGRSFWWNTD